MERDVDLGTGYAFKRLVLGRPLATSRLEHERLGRPTALAVFSSDNMSSVAYATEEILRVLIPAIGILAFTYVLPISAVIVLIEAILIFSYRQTIKAYPTAGGAYIVTKDNLGLLPAQLAGVALLVDYVLTVSVSTAAGVQAISSLVPLGVPLRIVFSLVFVVDDRLREPAGGAGVGQDLRRADVPVHRQPGSHVRDRGSTRSCPAISSRSRSSSRSRTARSRRSPEPSRCSSCSGRSRPAEPR